MVGKFDCLNVLALQTMQRNLFQRKTSEVELMSAPETVGNLPKMQLNNKQGERATRG